MVGQDRTRQPQELGKAGVNENALSHLQSICFTALIGREVGRRADAGRGEE
jgi:hypothetical protein